MRKRVQLAEVAETIFSSPSCQNNFSARPSHTSLYHHHHHHHCHQYCQEPHGSDNPDDILINLQDQEWNYGKHKTKIIYRDTWRLIFHLKHQRRNWEVYKTKKDKSNPFNGPPTVRIKEIKTSRKELGRCDSYDQTSDMRNKQCFVVFQNF